MRRTEWAKRPPIPDALPVNVVDNHTHLDHEHIDDVQRLLDRGAQAGVPRAVTIGCDLESARWTASIVGQFPQLIAGVAIHPNEAPRHARDGTLHDALSEIERLVDTPDVRVVGETGLDYFRTSAKDTEAVKAQQYSFRWHIDLAKRTGKVLQIHDRDSHDDVIRILREEGTPEKTVFHCFSGDADLARQALDLGCYLSFAGTLTFKNASNLREALVVTPLDRTLVETDAPYLTPMPHRGKPNSGYLIPHTVRFMADVRDLPVAEVCHGLNTATDEVYGTW